MKNQVKVTVYEAVETIVNIDFPCCYRSKEEIVELREYYRFTDENSYTRVYPYGMSIRTKTDDKNTNLSTEFKKLVAIQDEIFEAKLDETMDAIRSTYLATKASIEKQYNEEELREAEREEAEQEKWDNHRNH